MRLFEIKAEFEKLFNECFDEETGEITDVEAWATLEALEEEKLQNTVAYYKNLISDAKELKEAAKELTARAKRYESKAESISRLLDNYLQGRKFECVEGVCKYTKSTTAEQTDEMAFLLWDERFNYGTSEFKPDKMAIKQAIKSGKDVAGWAVVEHNNFSVK